MDLSKVKVSDWLMMAAGAVMLIFGLALDWATFGGEGGRGPFDYFLTGGISWLLVVAAGVVVALLAFDRIKAESAPWTLILVAATGLATLLMLIRILMGGGEQQGFDLDRGIGMWIAFLAAIVALVGAVMKFMESGGNLKDLTDVNKIKGEFQQSRSGGSDATPPPPPPPSGGGTPPPPPPSS